ncbi:hypothetical protein [Streptomyces olivochromogenes]|uniref:hypothetical protein n=1 Tax=Streptomyces olivochromogenes TaxID=1963 RepID=UPI00369308D1
MRIPASSPPALFPPATSAIVTGGGSGIGAVAVRRPLVEGARLTAAGTNAEKLARPREQAS